MAPGVVERTLAPGLALAACGSLAACFSPSPPRGAPCGPDEWCPSPLVCLGGRCEPPGTQLGDAGLDDAPDGSTDAPVDAALVCPPGFTSNDFGTCHATFAGPQTWVAAEMDCEQRGGHLVVPTSLAEAMSLPPSSWIGISDRAVEGTFFAVTGAALEFENWAPGEPNGAADCAQVAPLGGMGRWYVQPCTFPFGGYVCEYDGAPANPAAY